MQHIFPVIFATCVIIAFGLAEILLLRHLNKPWWTIRLVRIAAWGLPLFGIIMVILWAIGEYHTRDWLAYPAAVLLMLTAVLELSLMLSLPFSGMVHLLHILAGRFKKWRTNGETDEIDSSRRSTLKTLAAALPIAAISTGATGVALAFSDVRVYTRKLFIDELPTPLEGMRILHLSDLHLRHYITLDGVAELLTRAESFAPDLVLVTGDVADDLRLLPDTLKMITDLKPSLGCFACLGNHEYFRGITTVKRVFDNSSLPLLVNQGLHSTMDSMKIFVGGIDDPITMGAKNVPFFERTISEVMARSQPGDFSILMSHRPDALDNAAHQGVNLILAGHTHGGQIGLQGRSIFEKVWPDRYLWGHYRIDKTHLYTSCGIGHWFPFRLGCPPEAPILELHRS